MTNGEVVFEEFCNSNNIRFNKIPECDEESPDYLVEFCGNEVIVEIKDIEMNEEELEAEKKLNEGEIVTWGSQHVGDRIRYKIDKAKGQIKNRTKGRMPSILVLHDTRPSIFNLLTPYEFKVAMYGFESIKLAVPKSYSAPPREVGRFFGPKGRKLSFNSKNYISALAKIDKNFSTGEITFFIYHNLFANVPADPVLFSSLKSLKQFQLEEGDGPKFRNWLEIKL